MMLLLAWTGTARADEVTIGNGTVSFYELPFNMKHKYSLTQQLYLAEELGGSGVITSISFHYAYSSPFTMNGVQVYLKEVDYTTFTTATLEDWSTMTAVYTGTIGVNSEGLMEIAFTTPYTYEGGNLMIGFQVTTWGESWPGVNWYGVNQASDSYAAVSNFADESHEWGSEIGQVNFIP